MQQVRSNKLPVGKALTQFDRLMNHAEDQLRGEYDYYGDAADRFQTEINALRARRAQLFSAGVGIANPGDLSQSTINMLNTLHASGVLTDQFAQGLRDEVAFRAKKDNNQTPSAKHLDAVLADLNLNPIRTVKNPVRLPDIADLEKLVAQLDQVLENGSSQSQPAQDLDSTNRM